MFCMCYANAVSFIEFLMYFCLTWENVDTLLITDRKLLHCKLSNLCKILCVDKTGFLRPAHIYCGIASG